MMAVAAFMVCGVTAFYTHRAAHGRTAEERAAYWIGEKAGEQAPHDAKLPTLAELKRSGLATISTGGVPVTMTFGGGRPWRLAIVPDPSNLFLIVQEAPS